jgi:hypothetical protein
MYLAKREEGRFRCIPGQKEGRMSDLTLIKIMILGMMFTPFTILATLAGSKALLSLIMHTHVVQSDTRTPETSAPPKI